MAGPAPGRREQAKAERRRRIVGAARDLIRETGTTDLSMRSLAQRAGVSLTTPYNLFGSKRAVVLAVLEDERDFANRFERLATDNSLERIFAAHDLAFGYYARDPGFYRAIWRALLNTTGADETGLATPERLAQSRAIWTGLLGAARADGYLDPPVSIASLERTLSHIAGGALLSWTMGGIATDRLGPSVGLGYALCLSGLATEAGRPRIAERLARYRAELKRAAPDAASDLAGDTGADAVAGRG